MTPTVETVIADQNQIYQISPKQEKEKVQTVIRNLLDDDAAASPVVPID